MARTRRAQPDDPTARTYRVAVLGSSGGNLRSHGGDDPATLLGEVHRQLTAAGIELTAIQFVAAAGSMDSTEESAPATLWELVDGVPLPVQHGSLAEINELAARRDAELAEAVHAGRLDGLVLISADPAGTNQRVVRAAAAGQLPASGTGGTSIATAQSMGLRLVSASGTTGTTNATRAVAYTSGLARHWDLRYRPVLGASNTVAKGSPWRRISVRGIMVSSIPAFIAMALLLAISKIPGLDVVSEVFDTLIDGLPIVVAAMAARKVSGLDEVGVVAGAIAGILSVPGGIVGGFVGGVLAGVLASYLLAWTLAHRFPATTANIAAGGIAGLVPGLLVYYALAPLTSALGGGVKDGVTQLLEFSPLLAGAAAGLVIWPAIMAGVYHSVILPLVLLEMGEKGHSFFGAIDLVALVMVSLGITTANLVAPRASGERALAASGAAVNFGFGTFVEASYPFMLADKKVFAGALLSAGLGGLVVGAVGAEATAYVPSLVAPFVSTNAVGIVLAMLTAAAAAFTCTLLINLRARRRAAATS
ncbi:hypothetical protein EV191_108176 [Tamaricihabitans halophyticus]|uniref:PTS sugar transporter n=1 Tax=Tamaricihabitans halophyticus TaxID=1262583 RepID=A0A4R2QL63_9PSEU|nr:hypothetical protein EV191_108176 [Tamaricihabitans halophyticus]